MNTSQQLAWDNLQSAYRVYCLRSIQGNDIARVGSLAAIIDAVEYAGCYLPHEHRIINDKIGFQNVQS